MYPGHPHPVRAPWQPSLTTLAILAIQFATVATLAHLGTLASLALLATLATLVPLSTCFSYSLAGVNRWALELKKLISFRHSLHLTLKILPESGA